MITQDFEAVTLSRSFASSPISRPERFTVIASRKFVREEENPVNRIEVTVPTDNPHWTEEFLDGFSKPELPEYFVDRDFPGWLAWGKKFRATRARPLEFTDYDELESSVRKQIGEPLTREWYEKFFGYMKQEPRDSSSDRFRVHNVALLIHTLDLTLTDMTSATFEDIKDLIKATFEDGTDKHQHRATSEIIAALLVCVWSDPSKSAIRSGHMPCQLCWTSLLTG
jgi:proteasome activator subunit 4